MTIRELRREKGLTQEQLGEILGVSPKTIAAYESGKTKPGAGVAARIRELYGVVVETAGKTAEQAAPQNPEIYIQSPLGGNITPEEIMAKVPEGIDAVYVRVDQNKLWWVRGVEYGDVDIWE